MAAIRRIKTKRLILEPAIVSDKSKEFAQAIHEANEFEWYFGIEETKERLQNLSIKRKNFYNIFNQERNFIGYVGLHREENDYEIEIYILKDYRRRGYAKESLMAIMKEAFEGNIMETMEVDFSRIISSVRTENKASRLLMEQCGFKENKEMAALCILFNVMPEDEELGQPIFIANYYITREMFLSLLEDNELNFT